MKKPKTIPRQHPLVGQYFHQVSDGDKVGWQGYVLSNPEPGWFFVQLFECLMGSPNMRRLVPFSQMTDWIFYHDQESFDHSAERGVAHRLMETRRRRMEAAKTNGVPA